MGGHTAVYCPDCRAARVKERDRKRNAFQRSKARKLGSIDLCSACGKEYVVKTGPQKYCPICAKERAKQSSKKAYGRLKNDPERLAAKIARIVRWAANNQDRVKEISRRCYLKNKDKHVVLRRLRTGLKILPLYRNAKCPKCGVVFTVTERAQRYCPNCGRKVKKRA